MRIGQTVDGNYVIADDSFKKTFPRNKDALLVMGSKENKRFETKVEVPSSPCGISKISGPDMIILK
jgi:hypothetical protein